MALSKSVSINGFDARTKWGLEITSIDMRGLGPVRRASTVGGEMRGRVGQTSFHDEKVIRLSGQISGTSHSNLMLRIKNLAQALGIGQDGRRVVILKLEDSATEWVCQYAGDFQVKDISNAWFTANLAEISFSLVMQTGFGIELVVTHAFAGIGDKICKLVQVSTADCPAHPIIMVKNTNAAAITALTLVNFAKRRILRKLTGTITAGAGPSMGPATGAFGQGLNIGTGTDSLAYAASKLYPHSGAWTIGFRFKRIFTALSRTFWETSSGNNRLRFNSISGNLELVLNNVVSATFNNPLTALPTSAFAWVICRNRINPNLSTNQDIFIDGVQGNQASDSPPSTDSGANINLGTNASGGERAEGIFDEVIIWNRALQDEEITYLNGLSRPASNLEDVCFYADFENGVDGVGNSNIETVFSGISLAQNDSLIIDCEKQTAKKITNLFATTDQLSAFSGEFIALEPADNVVQLLQTGGGAAGTDVTIFYSPRRAA